jgi:hypothetical protein
MVVVSEVAALLVPDRRGTSTDIPIFSLQLSLVSEVLHCCLMMHSKILFEQFANATFLRDFESFQSQTRGWSSSVHFTLFFSVSYAACLAQARYTSPTNLFHHHSLVNFTIWRRVRHDVDVDLDRHHFSSFSSDLVSHSMFLPTVIKSLADIVFQIKLPLCSCCS